MTTSFDISGKPYQLVLHNATVIHANKYSETSGGWGSLPLRSTLKMEIVFRSKEDGQDWQVKINNEDLPLYTEQEVTVISLENYIIGFIDKQTSKYYYIDNDFASLLELGIALYKVWLAGILIGITAMMLTPLPYKFIAAFAPFLLCWVIYILKKWRINREFSSKIDAYLSDE